MESGTQSAEGCIVIDIQWAKSRDESMVFREWNLKWEIWNPASRIQKAVNQGKENQESESRNESMSGSMYLGKEIRNSGSGT